MRRQRHDAAADDDYALLYCRAMLAPLFFIRCASHYAIFFAIATRRRHALLLLCRQRYVDMLLIADDIAADAAAAADFATPRHAANTL